MSFNFGFGGDDIDNETGEDDAGVGAGIADGECLVASASPRLLRIEELLTKLPSKIAWNIVTVKSPRGRTLLLPRRELFDVRMQMMAEDDNLGSTTNIPGLDDSDIRTNVYEGGFKSWECSLDLASLLLDQCIDDAPQIDHVIEMGCGTAIPSSVLYQYAITQRLPISFTFTDYNADVLELVTFPNVFLTWVSTLATNLGPDGNGLIHLMQGATGDLEVTDILKQSFLDVMSADHRRLTFIAGSWSPIDSWLQLVATNSRLATLVLASETIYSPVALQTFATATTSILRNIQAGKAIVAAKRVYFGVGGSVDAFKAECAQQGATCLEIEDLGIDLGQVEGIRRCLLEVQIIQ